MEAGSSVAVFGVGSVGLTAPLAAKATGAEAVIAVDLHPSRLEQAAEPGAVTTILGGDNASVVEQVRELTEHGTHSGDLVLDGHTLSGGQLVSVIEGDADLRHSSHN